MATVVTTRISRRRKLLALAAAGGLLLVAVVAGAGLAYRRWIADGGPLRGTGQDPAPALEAADDPDRGSIAFARSGQIVAGPEVAVTVEPPAGATEMQVGLDPTFSSAEWVPVALSTTLRVDDTGYQMLFGRFRSGAAAEPSPVSVDGITIDPGYEAAISSASGLHRPSWARPLSATTVMVRIEAGRLQPGVQEPYDFDDPPPGDRVSGDGGAHTVERDGEPYGRQVDGSDDLLRPYDRLIGRPLDGEALAGGSWTVTSDSDAGFGGGVAPVEVERITRTAGSGSGPGETRVIPAVHDVVLRLPAPLTPGNSYLVTPPADLGEPVELVLEPTVTQSPAVHVNQNGYGPDDRLKVGYLSGLFGGIGELSYAEGTPFSVIDTSSGRTVLDGASVRRPGGDELGQGDLTGSEVHELDFSAVTEPGRYRLCVEGVGCSADFPIDDRVWLDLTVGIGRAMYHQRSGVSLGPPYTAVGRPRPYHPDDGMVIHESTYRLLDTVDAPLDELFAQLVAERTDTVVPGAWGGHFDAGDWDRRIEHLYWVRAVAELVELHPERYAGLDLGIPESGDAVPDLLDEGLWTLDLFHRLQRDDGAIRGGVEASEHPLADNTSWTDDLAVFAYAPDPLSSYLYAGVAAQVATVLQPYDQARSAGYADSALRAMEWAEAQPTEPRHADLVVSHRSVAAAAMLKLTGDQRWHDAFVEATTLDDGVDPNLSCHEHGRCDAAWIYLGIDESQTDPALRATIEQSFAATAEEILAAAAETSFGWAVENPFVPLIWGLGVGGSPSSVGLLRAYELTGDERYRDGALRSAAVSLGANPLNTAFVTGVGANPVRHPLIVDTLNGGLPVWAGTPVYGNHRVNTLADESWVDEFVLGPAGVEPLAAELPYLWQWFDVSAVAMFNEYTVHQSHAEAVYAYGLLAAS